MFAHQQTPSTTPWQPDEFSTVEYTTPRTIQFQFSDEIRPFLTVHEVTKLEVHQHTAEVKVYNPDYAGPIMVVVEYDFYIEMDDL
jgi:hypothetical protein